MRRVIRLGRIIAAASALVCGGAIGSAEQTTPPRALRLAKSVPAAWSGHQGDLIQVGIRCDSQGNLYLQPWISTDGDSGASVSVEEIKVDGAKGPEFSLHSLSGPQGLGPDSSRQLNTSLGDFAVNAQGRVFLLVRRCMQSGCGVEVIQFEHDGQRGSMTELAGKSLAHLVPQRLVVFPDTRFFVAGLLEGPTTTFDYYARVYDADGKLSFVINDLPGDAKPKRLPPAMDGRTYEEKIGFSMAVGDGRRNVYLIRPLNHPLIYVIGEDGAIVHHFPIVPPSQDAVPIGVGNAGNGMAIIQFGKQSKDGQVTATGNLLSVVDAGTGRTVATYTADGKTGGFFGCLLPGSRFEFLGGQWAGNGESWAIRFDFP